MCGSRLAGTLSLSLLWACAVLPGVASVKAQTSPAAQERTFEFLYQVHVPAASAAGSCYLWIPVPQSDAYQEIRDLRLLSAAAYKLVRDPEYGNQIAQFTPSAEQAAAGYDVQLRFAVTRHEHRVLRDGAALPHVPAPSRDALLGRYLQADRLVPLDGVIADLSRAKTAGAATPLEKARRVYDYVVATMRYDKSGEGWGHGDAIWACTSKRGNCTDFHSLFIGMMRATGIPARFEIGFPIPGDKSHGEIYGYHCWAEFYLDDVGWVPVDASEAWKNPANKEYFFGAHDSNRVFFTYGRDLRLSPAQKGAPLNYFIYPYAEANGQPLQNLQTHFSFRDLPRNAAVSAATR